jgi:Right handed beta helix region
VFVRRHVSRGPRRRPFALALLLGALIALAVPAFATADTFVVNSAGDAGQATGAEAKCETESGPLECTLRAALKAANFNAALDHIVFSPVVFNGEPADTISPATPLPEAINPVDIDGSECNAGSTVPCLTGTSVVGNGLLVLKAGESKIQHLLVTVPSGVVGIRAAGAGAGEELLDNTIAMTGTGNPSTGIESSFGASGALIEGNKITSAFGFNYPLAIRGASNLILGNEILSSGCCEAGISLELGAAGNQIGGDTPGSENVIAGFGGGAILMSGSSNNEVRRNRGENGLSFINGASVAQPVITEALQSSVAGTAEPGATVRLFRKATEYAGEIEGFLGETHADSITGNWKVTFAKAPTDTFVAATQTLAGSTSGLGETKVLLEEPGTGGGGGGGPTGTGATPATPPATPISTPAPANPIVKITKGPKTSTATTAKFTFKASPASGAIFECKLDAAKWAKCKSAKTYKKVKPGKHTFQVRAKANGLTGAVAKFKFTVKS